MRVYQQSAEIQTIQHKKIISQIEKKKTLPSSNPLLNINFFQNIKQMRDMSVGAIGETAIGSILKVLPDSWIMFENVLIPTTKGKSTEIDRLLIGHTGIYLIEVKTWKGSFSAYQDKWKKREGEKWVSLEQSPTQQSLYHQRIFSQWLSFKIPNIPNNSIIAPVIFPIAKWIGAKECCVPVFTNLNDLFKLLTENNQILSDNLVGNIAQAIISVSLNDLDPALVTEYKNAHLKIF